MNGDTHVMSTTDRLVYMAHQIARNMAAMSEEDAVAALAGHLTSYWDPRMKDQMIDIARQEPDRLSTIVAAAVARLAQGRTASPTDTYQFNAVNEVGHCDAG